MASLEQALEAVQKHKAAKKVAPELVREGTQIVIPSSMPIDEAIKWMMIKKDEDERLVGVHAEFSDAFPLDSLVCLQYAIEEQFGWSATSQQTNPFTGEKHAAAAMVAVPIDGNGTTMEVPFGQFELPGIDGKLQVGINWIGTPALILGGEVRNRNVQAMHDLIARTKTAIKMRSIYKGKAVRLSYAWQRRDESFHPIQHAPAFLNLSDVSENGLVFSRDIMQQLALGLFAPIEKANICRSMNIPLKRGVLLEGAPGTGKTLTALVTAKKAMQAGWTFVYLNEHDDLENGIVFAKKYAPAVLFLEDVDKVMDEGDRDVKFRRILNLLDGIDTKDAELITVFTTNFVEKLDPVIMRPGRLDTVVHLDAPDDVAAENLVSLYGGNDLSDTIDFEAVGKALKGKIPAVIREIVERAKLATIARTENGQQLPPVETDDLLTMARLMDNHIRLLNKPTGEKEVPFTLVLSGKTKDGAALVSGMPQKAAKAA